MHGPLNVKFREELRPYKLQINNIRSRILDYIIRGHEHTEMTVVTYIYIYIYIYIYQWLI
jgi:hypothetical protein